MVFGRARAASVARSTSPSLDGTNGFRLDGIDAYDYSGQSVSGAGDVNGDGFDDLIVGAPGADPGGRCYAGESYVVFGGNFTGAVDASSATRATTPSSVRRRRDLIVGAQGDDTLIGNGGIDLLNGGAGDDSSPCSIPRPRASAPAARASAAAASTRSGSTGRRQPRPGAISDLFVQDVERVDLNGNGNELALDIREILNIDDNSNS